MFFLGLQFGGNQYPWNSSVVIGLLVGAAATFAVFLVWESHQGDGAMVPFAMLKHRVIWSAAMTLFFSLSSILMADYYLAIFFQAVRDDSPLMSGVHMLPTTLGLIAFTMVSGSMSKCVWPDFAPPSLLPHVVIYLTTVVLHSRSARLLPSLDPFGRFTICHRLRAPLAFKSYHHRCILDRVPGSLWCWQRLSSRRCESFSLQT
jgi:hypothetical protein